MAGSQCQDSTGSRSRSAKKTKVASRIRSLVLKIAEIAVAKLDDSKTAAASNPNRKRFSCPPPRVGGDFAAVAQPAFSPSWSFRPVDNDDDDEEEKDNARNEEILRRLSSTSSSSPCESEEEEENVKNESICFYSSSPASSSFEPTYDVPSPPRPVLKQTSWRASSSAPVDDDDVFGRCRSYCDSDYRSRVGKSVSRGLRPKPQQPIHVYGNC